MLDDLRGEAGYDDPESEYEYEPEPVMAPEPSSQKLFLGMTPVQRFVIATMMMLMVVVLGCFFLVITEAIYLPLG